MSEKIKALRNLLGLTQEDVAKSLGISSRAYCLKENKPDNFTVKELKQLAATLKVETEAFFKNELTLSVRKAKGEWE